MYAGILQLLAARDLPAHDWSAGGGRGPGQPGSVYTADARPLRLLSVFVSRTVGGSFCSQEHPVIRSRTQMLHLQELKQPRWAMASRSPADASKQVMTVLACTSSHRNKSR